MYIYVNYVCYSLGTILKCSKKTNNWKITSQINCNRSYTSLRNMYYFKTFKTATNGTMQLTRFAVPYGTRLLIYCECRNIRASG